MKNNKNFNNNSESEISLIKGGKSLLRNITNLKKYSSTPKITKYKKLFNDGIIERFYNKNKSKTKINNNNKSVKYKTTYKSNNIKRNYKNINYVSDNNNTFNNDNDSLKYNKSFVNYSYNNNLYNQNHNNFINYFRIKHKQNNHNYNPEEIVKIYNKNNHNDIDVKYLIPLYDNNNKYTGLYKDLNYNNPQKQNLNLDEIKNNSKSSNEINKINHELLKLKYQHLLDKQDIDNKIKVGIRDLKNSLKNEIIRFRDFNDINYLNQNESNHNQEYNFEDSSFFEEQYKLYKNYNNKDLIEQKYKSLPKIISKKNERNLFSNSLNNRKKKNKNIVLSHSQSLGSITNNQYKLNRKNISEEFNEKKDYYFPNIKYQSPNNYQFINENRQLSKSNNAKKFRRFKTNKFFSDFDKIL